MEKDTQKQLKLVAPWINFYRELEALFALDPEVLVKYDDDEQTVKIFVDNPRKAEAIEFILPHERVYGAFTLKIEVIPSNKPVDNVTDALKYAFDCNPRFVCTEKVSTPFGDFNYALFTPMTVQYFNDDVGDIDGKRTTTVEQIAKEVLDLGSAWHICSTQTSSFRNKRELPF